MTNIAIAILILAVLAIICYGWEIMDPLSYEPYKNIIDISDLFFITALTLVLTLKE